MAVTAATCLPVDRRTSPRRPTARRECWGALLTVAMLAGCQGVAQMQNANGVQSYQRGQYAAAIQQFRQAIGTDPSNADSYYNLASAHHRVATLYQRRDDLAEAERLYNLCLDHNPNHVDCYRGLTVLLAQHGRNEEAQRLLGGWAQRSPSLAAPKIELARLYEEYGQPERARGYLLDALNADPYNARALAALGHVHETMGNASQALVDYQRSLSRDPFQPQIAARVASLQSVMGYAGGSPAGGTAAGGTRTVGLPQPPARY